MKLPKFKQEDLEKLAIAVLQLRAEDGRLTNIRLDQVLCEEICEQFPAEVLRPTAFSTLRVNVNE